MAALKLHIRISGDSQKKRRFANGRANETKSRMYGGVGTGLTLERFAAPLLICSTPCLEGECGKELENPRPRETSAVVRSRNESLHKSSAIYEARHYGKQDKEGARAGGTD
jgi:hypothetical protein